MITHKQPISTPTIPFVCLLFLFGFSSALVQSLLASTLIQVGERSIELTGIVKDHGGVTAYLLVRKGKWDSQMTLVSGQQKDGIELQQISFNPPEVKLGIDKKAVVLRIDPEQKSQTSIESTNEVSYALTNMPLSQLIDLYGTLSGRTVIQDMTVPDVAITDAADAQRAKAVEMLRASLKAKGIILTNYLAKFALLGKDPSHSPTLPNFPPHLEGKAADEVIPASMMFVSGMPLAQFVQLYELFSGRKVLVPPGIPPVAINLKQQADLTRAELVHAFDTFFTLNGFHLKPDGNGDWQLSR
ncbi:MAG: hypothetical protein HY674_06095 [Chloroflexi bacterium]|nr:hypothetical protein [Chloroflexota bacterium]